MPGLSALSAASRQDGPMTYSRAVNRRCRLAIVLAMMLSVLPPASGLAQSPDTGLLGISPSRRLVSDKPPVLLTPVHFSNTTKLRYDVRVFPALLGQRLDGTIFIKTDPSSLAAAKRIVTLQGKLAYVMQPGEREQLSVRWNLLPPGLRAAALGAVFQAKPRVTSGQLNNIIRLVNSNFLTLPGPAKRDIAIKDIETQQGPGPRKTLLLAPIVANHGQVFEQPHRAHVAILDARHHVRVVQPFQGDIVFPGATRRYPVVVTKVLPAGNYTAVAAFRVRGLPPVVHSVPFRLVGPNQLPTARIGLQALRAEGEAGAAAHVSVEVANTGNLKVTPRVEVVLYRFFQGQRLPGALARKSVALPSLPPRGRRTISLAIGNLQQRGYTVVASASAPGAQQVTASTDFNARRSEGFFKRFRRWIGDHPLVVIGIVLLLALLLFLAFLRRYQRKIEARAAVRASAAPPAAVEPTPVVAAPSAGAEAPGTATSPPGPVVDINSASIEELQTLPGVGRRAAQRIVDHRDEYGAFDSVDGLAAVEGFDAERIAALRTRAVTRAGQ